MTAAEWIVRRICRLLPPRLTDWGEAMAQEAASIERTSAALIFAVGCVAWVIRQALGQALQSALTPSKATSDQPSRSRTTALACAIAATGLGLVYLAVAGAPMRHLTLNATALIAGLILALPFRRRDPVSPPFIGVISIALGIGLLLTAALGDEASGARRWISLGDVVLQPSLIGLPFLLVAFARTRNILTATGVILAVVALAWQPDAAMVGAAVAALGAAALTRRDRPSLIVLTVASACFIVALARPNAVPAAQFVDGVFRTASAAGGVDRRPASAAAVFVGPPTRSRSGSGSHRLRRGLAGDHGGGPFRRLPHPGGRLRRKRHCRIPAIDARSSARESQTSTAGSRGRRSRAQGKVWPSLRRGISSPYRGASGSHANSALFLDLNFRLLIAPPRASGLPVGAGGRSPPRPRECRLRRAVPLRARG